jgi:hypothetical protein
LLKKKNKIEIPSKANKKFRFKTEEPALKEVTF